MADTNPYASRMITALETSQLDMLSQNVLAILKRRGVLGGSEQNGMLGEHNDRKISKNPISLLQEMTAKHGYPLPEYTEFQIGVKWAAIVTIPSTGGMSYGNVSEPFRTKRQARAAAAKAILVAHGVFEA